MMKYFITVKLLKLWTYEFAIFLVFTRGEYLAVVILMT